MLARPRVEVARDVLALEIALQHLLEVLPDHQRRDVLQVGQALQEDDAHHQLVGVLHLLDQFLALLLGELGEAPVVEHAVVQPVLVDGAQLVLEGLVQDVDDLFLALHAASPVPGSPIWVRYHAIDPQRTRRRRLAAARMS